MPMLWNEYKIWVHFDNHWEAVTGWLGDFNRTHRRELSKQSYPRRCVAIEYRNVVL